MYKAHAQADLRQTFCTNYGKPIHSKLADTHLTDFDYTNEIRNIHHDVMACTYNGSVIKILGYYLIRNQN